LDDYAESIGVPRDGHREWSSHFGFQKDTIATLLEKYDDEMGHPLNEVMPFFYYLKNYPTWDNFMLEFKSVLPNYGT